MNNQRLCTVTLAIAGLAFFGTVNAAVNAAINAAANAAINAATLKIPMHAVTPNGVAQSIGTITATETSGGVQFTTALRQQHLSQPDQ